MKGNNKGISLLELIIVISIMAILTGILVPNFLRYLRISGKKSPSDAVGCGMNCQLFMNFRQENPNRRSRLRDELPATYCCSNICCGIIKP